MIILVGGQKGGTGKTSVATTLAAMRAQAGHAVLLVDADPQGTSLAWSEARPEDAARVVCVAKAGKTFRRDVQDLAERYDDVVIDAGGRDSYELRSALLFADRLYTPLQPSYADAWTLGHVEDLVDQASQLRGPMEAFVLLNRASTNPNVSEATDLAAHLREAFDQLVYSGIVLKERAAWRRALGFGLCVAEMSPPDPKAVAEAAALYKHVYSHAD